ncbi:MAG: peptidoglycan-binding protein LysM [Thermoanaerobaculia bacterium]
MGLIDFVKNVGRKLDHSQNKTQTTQSQGQHPQNPAQAQQGQAQMAARQAAQQQERGRENAVVSLINGMGFKVEDLIADIEGDTIRVKGRVNSQEEREKIILLVGNTDGVAHVDDQLQVANPQPEGQYYDVKSGDSLSKIAKQFYGDANKYNLIFEANKPMLKDPDEIYPGQKLRIPAAAGVHA